MIETGSFSLITNIGKVKESIAIIHLFCSALVSAVSPCVNGKGHDCTVHASNQSYIKEYPYTVSTYSRRLARITGSGAILDGDWILVTASQLYNYPVDDIIIRAGSDYGRVGGQYSRISKIFTNFTNNYKVDIALLKIRDKLVFNTRVQPINIADYVPQEGSKAILSGFGRKEDTTGELNVGQFEIVSSEICNWMYHDVTVFCADAFDSKLAFDDLGDPLAQEKELVGIFVGSEGVWPYAFIPVARWREDIIDIMKKNSAPGNDPDKINDSYYEGIEDDVN